MAHHHQPLHQILHQRAHTEQQDLEDTMSPPKERVNEDEDKLTPTRLRVLVQQTTTIRIIRSPERTIASSTTTRRPSFTTRSRSTTTRHIPTTTTRSTSTSQSTISTKAKKTTSSHDRALTSTSTSTSSSSTSTSSAEPKTTKETSIEETISTTTLERNLGSGSTSSILSPATTSISPSATTTPSNESSSRGGTSPGIKAGIAVGVIGGLFCLCAVVWFFVMRRNRNASREALDDEKSSKPLGDNSPIVDGTSTVLGAAAGVGAGSDSRFTRPATSASNQSANPFGRGAEQINSPVSGSSMSPASPRGSRDPFASTPSPSNGSNAAALAGATAMGAAGVGAVTTAAAPLKRKESRRQTPNLDLTISMTNSGSLAPIPSSPATTEYSVTSMAPGQPMPMTNGAGIIAAAGGPPGSTVHRVQLDFQPTLEDELELKTGQLVRLLHEYDDGWALCIRLDRSQQGVVPRTCLSPRPVKPRQPNGPPVNPQGHPIQPRSPPGQGRPPMGPIMMVPGHRSQSPGPGSPRSQSPAMGPRYSPQSPPAGQQMSPDPGTPPIRAYSLISPPQSSTPHPQSPIDGSSPQPSPSGPSSMNPSPPPSSPSPSPPRAPKASNSLGQKPAPFHE